MHDPLWMRVFLGVHITAGSGAFLLAPLALVTAKGGKAHRLWGKIYFWCMAVVASTALVMSIYRPILFLALVAIFSFYSAFVAYRALGQKAAWKAAPVVHGLDWAAAVFCFVASATLALLGAFRPELVSHLRIPAIVFGAIGMPHCSRGHVGLHPSAQGEDVLVVRSPAGHDWQLHRRLDCLLRRHHRPLVHGAWWIWVLPVHNRRARNYRHHGLLQARRCLTSHVHPSVM